MFIKWLKDQGPEEGRAPISVLYDEVKAVTNVSARPNLIAVRQPNTLSMLGWVDRSLEQYDNLEQ